MKKFNLYTFLIFIFFSNSPMAQKPASIGYFRLGANLNFAAPEKGNDVFVMPALNITPGLRMIQGQDFAMVLALPVSVGISSDDYAHVTYLAVDLPAMLEFNFGPATGNSASRQPGFMFGAGAGYLIAGEYADANDDPENTTRQLDFWGWRLSFGVSFGKDTDGTRILLAANYGRNFTVDKKSMFSIGLYAIMGNRKQTEKINY
jgi:hypothetical protein